MFSTCLSKFSFSSFPLKGQKVALHLETNGVPQSTQSVTAPPNLQPFFDDLSESESQSSLISSLKVFTLATSSFSHNPQ